MAESNRDRINPSLLDRLTDEAPGAPGGRGGATTLSELRKSVLRDLAWLFNTTQVLNAESGEAWPQVRNSVVNYGLPPLAGTHASSIDIARLERALRQAIVNFEPRILPDSVTVKAQLERQSLDHHNVVSLQIAGLLWAQPVPIELLLRTQLDLESGQSRVDETVAGRR
ncbi:MAG TPA: type VI secretion system baseplate subunit TssE [Burkholderiales bacterium]|jgi:type VI secretion system protein ImpF